MFTAPADQSRIPRMIARLLGVRFFAALGLVVLIALIDQVLVRLVLARQSADAAVVERIGAQQMLVWRVAEGIARGGDGPGRERLAEDVGRLRRGHAALEAGGAEPEPLRSLAAAAGTVAGGGAVAAAEVRGAAERYGEGLQGMVRDLSEESRAREVRLGWWQGGLLAALMLALGFVDLFVFRPSLRRIRGSLEDLERVKRWAVEQEVAEASGRLERRIGQDLHDGVGQRMTGVAMMAKALSRRLAERPEAADAAAIVAEVNEAVAETRALSRQLFPAAAEAEGLGDALRDLASSTARLAGVECTCDWEEALVLPQVPADETTPAPMHLYRIVQESVANAVRHGHATRIHIAGRTDGGEGVLEVVDDGVGLRASSGSGSMGLGLRTMAYRAARLGAALRVGDEPGGGAAVRLRWPLAPPSGPATVPP